MIIDSYNQWVENTNYKNGDYADEELLLKPVKVVKQEVNRLYGLISIIFGQEAELWTAVTTYSQHDIISYTKNVGGDDYTTYYKSLQNTNYAKNPETETSYWEEMTYEDIHSGTFIHIDVTKIHSSVTQDGFVYLDTDGFYKAITQPNATNMLGYLHYNVAKVQTNGTLFVEGGTFTEGDNLYLSNDGNGSIVGPEDINVTIRPVGIALTADFINLNFSLQDAGDIDTTSRDYITAGEGEDTFTITGGYIPNYVDVFVNGIKMSDEDFIGDDGINIILNVPCTAGDQLDIISYGIVSFYDMYTKSEIDVMLAAINEAGIPVGGIISFNGSIISLPSNWQLCDGTNGTPDLTSKFIYGTQTQSEILTTGGTADSIIPEHAHTATFAGDELAPHSHEYTHNTYLNDNAGVGALGADGKNLTYDTSEVSGGTPTGSVSVDLTGEDGTGRNVPPFVKLAYIQRMI